MITGLHALGATPVDISYVEKDYKSFSIREVLNHGKSAYTYHLKSKVNPGLLIAIISKELGEKDEIGETDPERVLRLEYNIFIKIGSLMLQDAMEGFFDHISNKIERYKQEAV